MMQRNFDVRRCTEGLNVVEAKGLNVRKDVRGLSQTIKTAGLQVHHWLTFRDKTQIFGSFSFFFCPITMAAQTPPS